MEFEKIREIIAEQLSLSEDKITLETSFADDLGADSLDVSQIMVELQDEFDMEFEDEDADKIKTVGDIVNYIKSKNQ